MLGDQELLSAAGLTQGGKKVSLDSRAGAASLGASYATWGVWKRAEWLEVGACIGWSRARGDASIDAFSLRCCTQRCCAFQFSTHGLGQLSPESAGVRVEGRRSQTETERGCTDVGSPAPSLRMASVALH